MQIRPLLPLLGIAVLCYLAFSSQKPIGVEPADVSGFSALNAQKHIELMAAEPHFMGSPANAKVRDYILAEFERMGIEAKVEAQYIENRRGSSSFMQLARPENIIARLPGKNASKKVVVMGHYDSVLNSPGAGDDVHTVANILEVARLLKGQDLQNEVVFLITDGEELNLYGAKTYVENHDVAEIGILLNYEARGNSGPSISFEWSEGNAWLVKQLRKVGKRPIANSMSFEIYDRMPNGSDFTEFKDLGVPGINNAFIGGFSYYHSPDDTPENLKMESVQHAGENMYRLTQHFASIDLNGAGTQNASFFNFFGALIIYPVGLDLLLVILGLGLWGLLLMRWIKSQQISLVKYLLALLASLGLMAVIIGVTIGLGKLILGMYPHYDVFYAGQYYNHEWYLLAASGLSLVILWLGVSRLANRLQLESIKLAYLTILSLLMVAVYFMAPTATYIMSLPMLGLYAGVFLQELKPNTQEGWMGDLVGLLMMLFPIGLWTLAVHLVFLAFSLSLLAGPILLAVLFSLSSLLAFDHWWKKEQKALPLLGLLTFIGAMGAAHLQSKPTPEYPLPSNLFHVYDADKDSSFWVTNDRSTNIGNEKILNEAIERQIQIPWQVTRLAQSSEQRSTALVSSIEIDSTGEGLTVYNPQRSLYTTIQFTNPRQVERLYLEKQEVKAFDAEIEGPFTITLFGLGLDSLPINLVRKDSTAKIGIHLTTRYPSLPIKDEVPENALRTGGYSMVVKHIEF